MDIARLAETTQDTLTVRKVFGEAYERDGTTVIPAATIRGGAGGGGSRRTGSGAKDQEGEGGGFGINATPAGVYVLTDGKVRWVPAVDVKPDRGRRPARRPGRDPGHGPAPRPPPVRRHPVPLR